MKAANLHFAILICCCINYKAVTQDDAAELAKKLSNIAGK